MAELNNQLKTMVDERQNFINLISHHIRTPIMIIQMEARSLLSNNGNLNPAEQKRILNEIDRATDDIHQASLALINKLWDSEFINPPLLRLELIVIVEEVIEDLMPLANFKHIDIAFSPIKKSGKVQADRIITRQILFNVLSNALEYCQEKAKVTITLETDVDTVCVQTKDNGPGIPEDAMQRLFLAKSKSMGYTDSRGRGLQLSRSFAQKMGGDLLVESKSGKGTSVRLILPAVNES